MEDTKINWVVGYNSSSKYRISAARKYFMTEFPSSAARFLQTSFRINRNLFYRTEEFYGSTSPPLSRRGHKNQIIGLIRKMVAAVRGCGNTDLFVFVGAGVAGAGSLCCCLAQPGQVIKQ